ncbi:TRCF domain-containing protein [Cereibacter sphaeroides]|uniref:TRCF domain-containing protein n=1 Tax=Cereibacter sphaeroides TaxID=1063 RepID=UPI0011977476|nr:TRCF domain-containing protein [Cereibacter sphaeroides]GEM94346.1 hypothetical protein RSP03_34130 [Cereibacter sphaeroides]
MEPPIGLEALRLLDLGLSKATHLHITSDDARAEEIVRFLREIAPTLRPDVFPCWDCLPYDGASPTPDAMGRRMALLDAVREGDVRLVIVGPSGLLQRVPPVKAMRRFAVRAGEALDLCALRTFAARAGYAEDDRIDEPGEIAFRAEVVEVFAAGAERPVRIGLEKDRVTGIRRYDPVSLRSMEDVPEIDLLPVTELPESDFAKGPPPRGAEHRLPRAWPSLATLPDHLGQSFVIVPRIAEIDATEARLRDLLPEAQLRVAHGDLAPEELDRAMVDFAAGRGDILLATSIVETGLDVPRANTMIVMQPQLFGLAQLHQLRGRVGRGPRQAYCYLMHGPGDDLDEAALRRLGTLQAFDRLGAGAAVAAEDLDQRGAGELFGERQSGHVRLIGLPLYQHLLAQAVRAARGEPPTAQHVSLAMEGDGALPADYIPEAGLRLGLYRRLARAADPREVALLADEIEDRFGPPPAAAAGLLVAAEIRALARSLGIERVSAGQSGVALDLAPDACVERFAEDLPEGVTLEGRRLLRQEETDEDAARRALDLLRDLG